MALAIACWVRDTALEIDKKDLEYKRAMMNSMMLRSKTFKTNNPDAKLMADGMSKEQNKTKEQYKEFIWLIKG